jgi:hypothetical protein
MPVKQCLRRDDRAKLAQPLASQRPRLLAKLPALGVSADDAPSPEACPKDAVLGLQIVNRRRLLPLQSTGNQYEQELQQGRGRSHLRVAVGCLIFLRQPPSLKPRSSRIRSSFGTLRGFILHLRDLGFAIVHVIDPHPELPEEVDTDQSRRFRRNSRIKQLHSDLTAAKARFFITCDSEQRTLLVFLRHELVLDSRRKPPSSLAQDCETNLGDVDPRPSVFWLRWRRILHSPVLKWNPAKGGPWQTPAATAKDATIRIAIEAAFRPTSPPALFGRFGSRTGKRSRASVALRLASRATQGTDIGRGRLQRRRRCSSRHVVDERRRC